jgi:hypothetical protein
VASRRPRILDFDIENRPLSYLGGDFTTAEVTAIAACWMGEPKTMQVWLLHPPPDAYQSLGVMLDGFLELYNAADLVTGHYIRKHDLPIINGSLMEQGYGPLGEKLTADTKLDLVSHGGAISASQENLAAMLCVRAPKVHMNNEMWRDANRLTFGGLELTKQRVVGDVLQHMALYRELVEMDLLRGPSVWRP